MVLRLKHGHSPISSAWTPTSPALKSLFVPNCAAGACRASGGQMAKAGLSQCPSRCRVSVLDGGFPAWAGADLPVETSPVSDDQLNVAASTAASPPASTSYHATLNVRT